MLGEPSQPLYLPSSPSHPIPTPLPSLSYLSLTPCVMLHVPPCSYNIEQEQKLAQETTVLVESYTVSPSASESFLASKLSSLVYFGLHR